MLRYALTTLGCKVNQYDGAALAAVLRRAGLAPASPARGRASSHADLVVVNTCCVTATAMRKSRQAIRRAARGAPGAAVLIVGCYCDYQPEAVRKALAAAAVPDHRAVVCGHHGDLAASVERAVRMLARGPNAPAAPPRRPDPGDDVWNDVPMSANAAVRGPASGGPKHTCIMSRRTAAIKQKSPGTRRLGPIDRFDGHQRAFVKVQDGCDAFCTYCVVPFTRPRVWSRPIEDVVAECRGLVAAGHKEIVLSGVFLGAYGRETALRRRWARGGSRLGELLRRVAGIEGLWRVRLSSLEPGDLTDRLIATCRALPNFAPHVHLPLQSGSPRILRRMNRQYSAEQYRRAVRRLREAFDRPALTTDVIVGFPGETEEDFAATCELARQAGVAKIHAFPFSPIQGTAAWAQRHEAPPPEVVKRRMAALCRLERQLALAYRRQFVGQAVEALVERVRPARDGSRPPARRTLRRALTDRYITVRFPAETAAGDLTGRIVRVQADKATAAGLRGRLVEII